jgi:8-oxo-dGTP pyrophosphatase MutT (NUDIX family)
MSEKNHWKKLSTKKIYENSWITLHEDSIIKPNGEEGIYGIVECKAATGIIPIYDDLTTVLVGQYRYTMNQYSWEIIEGGAELNETPKEAAIRELREEGGIIADQVEQLGGEIHLSNSHSSERGYLFIARGLSEGIQEPDDTEVLKLRRLPITDVLKLIEEGEIQDGLSIIGIYRVARYLKLI